MNVVYAKNPDLIERQVAGECLLVPLRRSLPEANALYVLNETGASLWRGIDGQRSLRAVLDLLLEEYQVGREELQKDAAVLIQDLLSIGALTVVPG